MNNLSVEDESEFALIGSGSNNISTRWFSYTCASCYITNYSNYMLNYRSLGDAEFINTACEGVSVKIIGVGYVRVKQTINGADSVMLLKDVGYGPKCRTKLKAISKAQRAGVGFEFQPYCTKTSCTGTASEQVLMNYRV